MILVKFIVLLLLAVIVVSLFSGLYFLVKDKGQTDRTVNALSVRIGLSILAIVVVMIAGATGVIELNPSPLSGQSSTTSDDSTASTTGQTDNDTPADEKRFGGGRRLETPAD